MMSEHHSGTKPETNSLSKSFPPGPDLPAEMLHKRPWLEIKYSCLKAEAQATVSNTAFMERAPMDILNIFYMYPYFSSYLFRVWTRAKQNRDTVPHVKPVITLMFTFVTVLT